MTSPLKITHTQVRRIALHSSLLYGQAKLPKGKDGVMSVIQKLGYTQIDTISVIERAHHHTLWTRCSDYKPEFMHQLMSDDKSIFEYWGHAMSYLPMENYRFYMHSFKRFNKPDGKWSKIRFEKTKTLLPKILKRIKNEGALGSKDFENDGAKKNSGWWDFKPAKIALELLYWQGKLMVASRQNFHRKYDLAERVLPSHINKIIPTIKEQTEFWIYRALQSYGIATVADIKKHLYHCDKKAIEKYLQVLVSSSKILQLQIEGLSESYYAVSEQFENNYPLKKKTDKLHILSPFDNAVINRDRLAKLFDFDYTIECYLPKEKRKFGYFVLPILWGDKFIGRLDAKADRKTKELIVHNIYFENKFKPTESFNKSFSKKIQSFAQFNSCNTISLRQSEQSLFTKELNNQI